MTDGRKLSAAQWHALEQAAVRPLWRVTGGWRCTDGRVISKAIANTLMTEGLLDIEHGAHGPRLSIRAKGRIALDGRKKVTA